MDCEPASDGSGLLTATAEENSRAGVHTVKWPFYEITVTVSKLREQSNGGLLADFDLLWPADTKYGEFKYFTRFNLKSAQTKASIARDLAGVAQGRLGASVEKSRYIIERVCDYVRTSFNTGEEGVELVDYVETSEDTAYRLWPYLQERQPTILYGQGNTGKSFLAVLFGYLIATGREHLSMKPQQGNVCYLDYETDPDTTKNRLRMVAAGFGEGVPSFFHYMHLLRPLRTNSTG